MKVIFLVLLVVLCVISSTVSGFGIPHARLVLVRHGESVWNKENKFTGWYDAPLSPTGHAEALAAGKLLKQEGLHFDVAHTSTLQRAIRTLWYALEETDSMAVPVTPAWQLNERHYGALQGLNKQEAVKQFGEQQVAIWRRSYDTPPPNVDANDIVHSPGVNAKYKDVPGARDVRAESLKTTLDRLIPYYNARIVPDIKAGKRVIIAAHGNSLRALVKHLDHIPDDVITEVNIPTATPLVYELDENLQPIPHKDALGPLKGHYLGNQDEIKARIEGVKNQSKAKK